MNLHKLYFIAAVCTALYFTSCDNMNDQHIGYLEEGEKIYAAKVDSVSAGAGKERIEMEVFVKSQRIESIRFYWNAHNDSIDFAIGNQTGNFKFMIENLPEREYLFQVVSFDKFGNISLPYEVSSLSYGENYRKVLSNRRIESLTKTSDGKAAFEWAALTDDALYTTLHYTSNIGKVITKVIPSAVSKDTIADFTPSAQFKYITTYRPKVNSPDTFDSNESTENFPE